MPRRAPSGPFARRLGARIKALRVRAGITQETLAWDCGFAKSHLSQIEAGKHVPSLPALLTIAKRLGVDSVDVLACDASNPLHLLLIAIHGMDRVAVREALKRLGLNDARRPERVPEAAEEGRPARPTK